RRLIVIDHSRMHVQPFTLRITLKHELCHLLLHRYIPVERLPKWLDEGVSQWVSDGISEIMIPRRTRVLVWASVTGNFLSLSSLNSRFPDDDRGLFLAYEQSRSIVEHIVVNYGRNGLLNLLQALRHGLDYHEAIESSLMVSAGEIEKRWRSEQRSWMILLSHAAAHLYTIIFMLGALALLVAYVRFQIRKRQLVDEEDVSSPWDHR
ncbi:MAG: peptidase MA family metallohydrolase, partial [Desulfomonilia bacterium]|nr:peptidase MA family metallohydrolase [Desulfomonilia bacterium]